MSKQLEIRQFDIREAHWSLDGKVLSNIRRIVFIVGQSVPQEEEWDGRDDASWHWLATDSDGHPIGTARLLPEGQIGRMAVIEAWRGYGVGAALLERAVDKARHLGFGSVFLNAQSHALGFYERAGFVAEGDEFMEAGIPHYRMTRSLALPDDEAQRVLPAGPAPDVSIRRFDTSEVSWSGEGKIITKLRQAVLEREQGQPGPVTDAADESAIHWHAQLLDGQTVGAVRMDLRGQLSRLVVSSECRRQGIGRALVELVEAKARRFGLHAIRLSAPASLEPFLSACGFVMETGTGQDAGQALLDYIKPIASEEVHDRPRTALAGDDFAEDAVYRLGEDNRLILLRKEDEFRNLILEMCRQASQSIRIFSPLLEHKLFDSAELKDICSALARRNKYTRIEILVYDPHRMVKNGHALLEISRKLPSSIGIRIVDPELRQLDHEFVLADDHGYIYRRDYEDFDGYANFSDQTECNRLGRSFKAAWESGLLDANLRQLRI